jgi:ArsR family transcriptional regulator
MQVRKQKKPAARGGAAPASRRRAGKGASAAAGNLQAAQTESPSRSAQGCCPPLESAADPRLFKALGDPTRVLILISLARCCGPKTVTQAAECCSVDLSVVSRHLAILRDAGVLSVRKQGRQIFYDVRYAELARTLRGLAEAIEACCPQ